MTKRLDIIEPHVTLLFAPRSRWVVLREDRLAHRMPVRPMSDRSVPRINPRETLSSSAILFCFSEEKVPCRRI